MTAPFGAGDKRPLYAIEKFNKDFPDVNVKHLLVDVTDGSTMSMDAMLAAGKAPNIYMDTLVRSSKYMTPAFALDLTKYVRDLKQYTDLGPYTRNGKVYGLPTPGGAQGMAINLDIMAEIGYTVPDNWTIDDFLKMAALVKAKYKGKKYATGMFAANQSGDYLINNWFFAFGAKYYPSGDYSHSILSSTGGEKAYEFFQLLDKNGYIPSGSGMLNDDDYALSWSIGEFAATAFFAGWMDSYWKTAIEQGLIKAPFKVKYVPFPRASNVKTVPTYMANAAIVVHATGTEQDLWASRLAEYLNDATAQGLMAPLKNMVSRKDVKEKTDDIYLAQIDAIIKKGGILDVGLTSPKFSATRVVHFPILQKVLAGKLTPKEAIKAYEAKINEVMSQ